MKGNDYKKFSSYYVLFIYIEYKKVELPKTIITCLELPYVEHMCSSFKKIVVSQENRANFYCTIYYM